jgi:hypothetical protein
MRPFAVGDRVVVLQSPHKAHAEFHGEALVVRVDNQDCIMVKLTSGTRIWTTWRSLNPKTSV